MKVETYYACGLDIGDKIQYTGTEALGKWPLGS
jgi:hypothetical protein